MQNLKNDSQDSTNCDLLHLEVDLSKDLQEIIALEEIKSAPKSGKRGVTEYTYGSSGCVYKPIVLLGAVFLLQVYLTCMGLSYNV